MCKYLHNSLCSTRTQQATQDNSLYYFFLRIWDQSAYPIVDYGDFSLTNISMNYSDYQMQTCFDCSNMSTVSSTTIGGTSTGSDYPGGSCQSAMKLYSQQIK